MFNVTNACYHMTHPFIRSYGDGDLTQADIVVDRGGTISKIMQFQEVQASFHRTAELVMLTEGHCYPTIRYMHDHNS